MGATLTDTTVQATHAQADEVFLTGEFNHWSVPGMRMKQTACDRWEARRPVRGHFACVALTCGRVIEFMTIHSTPAAHTPSSPEALADQVINGIKGGLNHVLA